ncbi:hypothetical protein A0H81_13558 [Grifola frondosa]|uniref:EF-hand domain-containing protein n=1 Tax=Grifola frondosa TaxID=5627 RepID=A0A1C7LQJ7_GRIFR|nr:hypothetical protein A0H81_13558 [Grifola frondosa]
MSRSSIVNPKVDPTLDHSSSDSTVTNSSDEFDWNAEDDAHSLAQQHHHDFKAKRGRAVYKAFMRLARPVRVLLVGSLGVGILITPFLVVQLRFNESAVRAQVHAWSLWLTVSWATAIGTYLLVDALPHIALAFLRVSGYKVERLRVPIELMTAVSTWLKLALDMGWAWIALSVIRETYKPAGSYWTVINRVMQALFSAGLLLLVEKVFLRYVAINFHRKALADRLAENRLGLTALDRLSNAHPAPASKRTPYASNGARKGHRSRMSSLDLLGMGARGAWSRSASPVPGEKADGAHAYAMSASASGTSSPDKEPRGEAGEKEPKSTGTRRRHRRNVVAAVIVDQLGGALGQVALKNKEGQYGSLYSAGKLARKLFSALSDVYPPRKHLVVDDFVPYFPTVADAHSAFALFDKDGNGDITRKEMREAVRRIYRERKALTASLKDVGSAVAKLDAVLLAVTLLILIFVCLLIFNRGDTIASLVPLATIILGFSFIFGHSAQTLFESLIFIFSTHVFDVGDLVMIDDQVLYVREFGLFSTTFRRVDGQEIIAPNALLAGSKLVHNLRRSSSMWESTTLMIAYDTPLAVIEQLRTRLSAYASQNSREWCGIAVNIDRMEYQNAVHLVVAMEHRPNWQDWGGRWARRTAFMRHLKTVLEDLDVRYAMPVQPVLLPRPVAQGTPNVDLRRAPSVRHASCETLGNAGAFQGSDYFAVAPSRNIRAGVDKFGMAAEGWGV